MTARLATFMLLILASAAPAPAAATTYGDTLLDAALRRDLKLHALTITATGRSKGPVALSRGSVSSRAVTVPLRNSLGETIGTLAADGARSRRRVAAMAAWLSRRILAADGLLDPDPFVAGTARAAQGQALVEVMVERHPRLVTLAMHVAPEGGVNAIVASNFGRIGKPADDDERRVIAEGAVLRETTDGGRRLAVELPQHDARGATIGALSTSFLVDERHPPAAALAEALALRDALAKATPSRAALWDGPRGRRH